MSGVHRRCHWEMGGWPVKFTFGVSSREAWHTGLVQVPGLDMSPHFVPYKTC